MIADFLFSLILFLCFMFLIVCLVNSSARARSKIVQPTNFIIAFFFLRKLLYYILLPGLLLK